MKRWKLALLSGIGANAANLAYTSNVKALSPIAYWPLAEASGSTVTDASGNGRNGTYTAVTLGTTGIGDGRTAATFDGATSFANVYSASLDSAFNNQEITLACWMQVSAVGIWTDTANHCMVHLGADITNNFVRIIKTTVDNTLQVRYAAGGTLKTASFVVSSPVGWVHVGVTVSKAADEVKMYINGVQQGGTQTALGIWAGALGGAFCTIGVQRTTLTMPWSGNLAHVAVWASALTPAQIGILATVV